MRSGGLKHRDEKDINYSKDKIKNNLIKRGFIEKVFGQVLPILQQQNPDLMQQFTQAAVNSMGEQNPGFSGFMNNVMNNSDMPSGPRPGPPPMRPQNMQHPSMPMRPPSPPSNRPDIRASRGQPPQSKGVEIDSGFSDLNEVEKSRPHQRPDMKGPSDLGDILSGLKTKQINKQSFETLIWEIQQTISRID